MTAHYFPNTALAISPTPTAIAALQPATTRFTDRDVLPNQTYTYQVTAIAGNFGSRETPPSDPASVTPR